MYKTTANNSTNTTTANNSTTNKTTASNTTTNKTTANNIQPRTFDPLRSVPLFRVWVSKGLTQADS